MSSSPPRLLLIEDDSELRAITRTLLTSENFDVIDGEDAEIVLPILCSEIRPDLLMTDLELPGMSGFELIERVRSYEAQMGVSALPILAFSSLPEEAAQAALDAGATALLRKPAPIPLLLETLRGLL
jgi:two-component system sensor histidine kinase EvgS